MDRVSSNGKFVRNLLRLAILFLLVSSIYVANSSRESTVFLYFLPILLILATAISGYIVLNNYLVSSSDSSLLLMLVLFLGLVYPDSVYRLKEGIVSLLLLWSVLLHIMFGVEGKGYGKLFISYLLLSVSILMMPQLFWLLPLFFLMSLFYKGSNSRLPIVMLGGVATPLLYYLGSLFIRDKGLNIGEMASCFTGSILDIHLYNPVTPLSLRSISVLVIFLIIILLLIYLFFSNRKQKIKIALTYNVTSVVIIALVVLGLLFWGDDIYILYALLYPYIGIIMFNYIKNTNSKRSAETLLTLFISLIIVLRIIGDLLPSL